MREQLSNNIRKTVLNWSSGKDAALAYYLLQQDNKFEVCSLLTTVNAEQDRVIMHGVREELLNMQAVRMRMQLKKIKLPASPGNDVYNQAMNTALDELKREGINCAAFGDIFLEDLKTYRVQQLQSVDIEAVFPLWGRGTKQLIEMLEQVGIKAMIVCVNEQCLSEEFLGRVVDARLLKDLPTNVDPCGENGEFHTFVFDAPYFTHPIELKKGEIVRRHYNKEAGTTNEPGFLFLDVYAD